MQVKLAGYNVDTEHMALVRRLLDEFYYFTDLENKISPRFRELMDQLKNDPLTPETISAAYARISRSEMGVRELRRDAYSSVNRARRSNERIVFGLGHSSVAEHAVFNLDITDASRLALEELESHRLASYTESSQRYIAMSGDYVIPDEIIGAGLKHDFESACDQLFDIYRQLTHRLESFHHQLEPKERTGRAREDARYVLPLACRGQVGMTVNARTAEALVRGFSQSNLAEIRVMGRQMLDEVRGVTPSLMRYVEPIPAKVTADRNIAKIARQLSETAASPNDGPVKLLAAPTYAENYTTAALLFRNSTCAFDSLSKVVANFTSEERTQLIQAAHQHLTAHEPLRREMELGYFIFEIILSASAFAQLKRHRISTLIKQDYLPSLGYTIPDAIVESGSAPLFHKAMETAESVYNTAITRLDDDHKAAAQYILTNAHRRRVLFQANARELNHLARLRLDRHAQWDIRSIAGELIRLARDACPNLMQFAMGKDEFELRGNQSDA